MIFLRYNIPAFQAFDNYVKQQAEAEFNLKLMTSDPVKQEYGQLTKSTYVLIKKNDKWDIKYFKIINGEFKGWYSFVGGISSIKGLNAALVSLPNNDCTILTKNTYMKCGPGTF